ncbi:MAG: class I SAM-dependent methyltransferase [Candidatus Palauibacterales bacterium]|nr:class I SAM-dependent methyltransferase [Candidatus Palauibacterales bacterium]MDP2528325.1 class I SAM-dependent methyltransferase [Candidatus Palauibacterales bacterium]MDP2584194.1 class I SAM-dependent methyltransferase [Candidatus Palauibacterales bacterium]
MNIEGRSETAAGVAAADRAPTHAPPCRFCGAPLTRTVVDLGMSPLANAYLEPEQLGEGEMFYPLHARVCEDCFLVQLEKFEQPEVIFGDYAYFSSYSDSWLKHAEAYVRMATDRFGLGQDSLVVELASNDGYLLQYFVEHDVPVLGVEPAANVAAAAEEKGIPTRVRFFGEAMARDLAEEGLRADLIIGNNVLAHVPELNDFVTGMRHLLKPRGVITMEFPHLVRLIEGNQFDTIYHEHFSYYSFLTVERIFAAHGLTLFDVEELPTHGGSLRIYGRHEEDDSHPVGERVGALRAREREGGYDTLAPYLAFGERVNRTKRRLLSFLVQAKNEGKSVVGYGAAAKGNTLLNYCGVRTDFLDYVVDRSPHKQDRHLPGTRIPIVAPERIAETRPDYVLILPWNLRDEIAGQMEHVRAWGGRFVVPIPEVAVF